MEIGLLRCSGNNTYGTLAEIHATLQEDEYIDKQGVIRCKKCNGYRMVQSPFTKQYHRCVCDCQQKANAEAERVEKWNAKQALLRKKSLLVGKYENATFMSADLTKVSNDYQIVFNRCMKYASMPDTIIEGGYGIYLYGECGTGKTFLSACIANELLSKGYGCIFTNMIDISQQIRSTFRKYSGDNEETIVERLSKVPFLFIDDIGTERLVDNNGNENWLQDIIYTIFNNRYTNRMPTIFTSNCNPVQLHKERGLMQKTAQRIAEMASGAVMELKSRFRQGEMIKKTKECPF